MATCRFKNFFQKMKKRWQYPLDKQFFYDILVYATGKSGKNRSLFPFRNHRTACFRFLSNVKKEIGYENEVYKVDASARTGRASFGAVRKIGALVDQETRRTACPSFGSPRQGATIPQRIFMRGIFRLFFGNPLQ